MRKYKWFCSVVLMASCLGAHAEDDSSLKKLNSWTCGSYLGPIRVSLQMPKELKVEIETEDLILCSVNRMHYDDYVNLFSDAAAIEKYADGIPWTSEEVFEMMQIWINRWETHDPFSAFAVYLKGEKNVFIGHMVLGHGAHQGQSELAFLFKPEFVAQGYCKQAAVALLYGYVPRLIKEEYFVNIGSDHCQPAPLSEIHATVRLDNPFYAQVFRRVGMQAGDTEFIWGAKRVHYAISAEEILSNKLIREEYASEKQEKTMNLSQ